MQVSTFVKWLHRISTITLALSTAVLAVMLHSRTPSEDYALHGKTAVSERIWLYITEYQGGNATVGPVFRYYLAAPVQDDVLAALERTAPFLTTDRDDVQVTRQDDRIEVRSHGKVYAFSNAVYFEDGGVPVMPRVDFIATGQAQE